VSELASGARAQPLRHLSIRVPWHDSAWNGTVCRHPRDNAACLVLKNTRARRDDAAEQALAGQSWENLSREQLPPCVSERGGFMSPFELMRYEDHAYSQSSPAHQHIIRTKLRIPPYSAACVPFRWMLRDHAEEIGRERNISLELDQEDKAHELMGFRTEWVQAKRNQLAPLDSFFSAIKPQQSLCFFYVKDSPLLDGAKVLVGVGRVTHLSEQVEYEYNGPGPLRCMIWERPVGHSIRPDFKDGFLLPYHQILERLVHEPALDVEQCIVRVPDDHWDQFSYASEYVSHDAAISVLLACHRALQVSGSIVSGNWDIPLRWISDRLSDIWKMRGPYPGLGAALCAFGVTHGNLLAYDLVSCLRENEDPWPVVDQAFADPKLLGGGLERYISRTLGQKWAILSEEKRSLLRLLARFDLTPKQATRFYQETDRDAARITVSDAELIANPYLLYELDRSSVDAIAISTVERGAYPEPIVRDAHPMPEPSRMDGAEDGRRVRALIVSALENAAVAGDTLRSRDAIISEVRKLPLEPPFSMDQELLAVVESSFTPVLTRVMMADGAPAYQLQRLDEMGRRIRDTVNRRIGGMRHRVAADWAGLLNRKLGGPAAPDDAAERAAREEKVAALVELAASRVSVLIGPAGTGKTTLLSVLCDLPEIKSGGIRLLAPTGKARVQLEKNAGIRAQTIAQFLIGLDRYDARTGAYRFSTAKPPVADARTVIIDEASMLTEEQLAAVLDAVKDVHRLILVGDPRQLPPIGSGRPFVDIVARLAPKNVGGTFPRVGPGYAELTIRRRQAGEARDDLLLAEWFSGEDPSPGADEVWERVIAGTDSATLRFVCWEEPDDLRDVLLDVLVRELGLTGRDDVVSFEQSLGGSLYEGHVYFHPGRNGEPGAAEKVEAWQILSPMRGQPYGVGALNRLIQHQFRRHMIAMATVNDWTRRVPRPLGPEEIVYGDKVINTVNRKRDDVFPENGALKYVANGEIGIAVGQFKGRSAKYKGLPWKLEVEFSSQPGVKYGFGPEDFSDEQASKLELAYAITVHKAQGSEFGTTILILPNPCPLLSPELLYTALTRQRGRVVILHQGDLSGLKHYAAPTYSETSRRLTNLFEPPSPVQVDDRFLEEGLIHRTRRGEAVRSKSEVIIADNLYARGLDYSYEAQLLLGGVTRYPDFTLADAETGRTVYWEHLGLLHDPSYRSRWERKLAWYSDHGILPFEQGGGQEGSLVVTRDDEQGAIHSDEIAALIARVFGL